MISTNFSVHSEYLPTVFWKQKSDRYNLQHNEIHVWKIKVSEHFNDLFKNYRHVLNKTEYRKAANFFWQQDCRRYLTGRIALRILLAEYLVKPATSIRFEVNRLKPGLVSESRLKYNISYSGEYIVIAIARCEIGVDVEKLNRDFEINSLLPKCFAPNEIKNIKKRPRKSCEPFFLQWTRKEAILKFTGQGIIEDLSIVPSLDGCHILDSNKLRIKENIRLSSFRLDHDCIASLVYPTYITDTKFFEW